MADLKRCNKCNENKPLAAYSKNSSKPDGKQHYCKQCQAKRNALPDVLERRRAAHQSRNPDQVEAGRKRNRTNRRKAYESRRDYVDDIKSAPCTDCGGTFPPCVMQFDHVSGDKLKGVGLMVAHGAPMAAIDAEIAKCELVCANCHAVRTWTRHPKRGEEVTAGM